MGSAGVVSASLYVVNDLQLTVIRKREYFRQKKRADPVNYKQGTAEYEANRRRKRKENHILFSFWTCLQLERSAYPFNIFERRT